MSWKIKTSKEVYKNKWMTVTEDEVETDFGEKLICGVVHKKPFALIIPWDGKFFTLVGQYRHAIQKFSWEFPQGHFEHHSIEETARMELKEETGISADSIKMIGHYYLGPGHHSQECMVFLAEKLTKGKPSLQEGEKGMKTMKVTFDELKEMIKTGKMEDGPTLAALSIFLTIYDSVTFQFRV
ncbi:MAG: NUDIX hydrolase [Candidatus Pacebacteria bacterium]|nr:NUDIX hydrolase [Candidatus Paceibacterota bacterium]